MSDPFGPPMGFNQMGDATPFTSFSTMGDVALFAKYSVQGDAVPHGLANSSVMGDATPFAFTGQGDRIANVHQVNPALDPLALHGPPVGPEAADRNAETHGRRSKFAERSAPDWDALSERLKMEEAQRKDAARRSSGSQAPTDTHSGESAEDGERFSTSAEQSKLQVTEIRQGSRPGRHDRKVVLAALLVGVLSGYLTVWRGRTSWIPSPPDWLPAPPAATPEVLLSGGGSWVEFVAVIAGLVVSVAALHAFVDVAAHWRNRHQG